MNQFLHGNYLLEIESDIRGNPSRFWHYIASKRKTSGYPLPMNYENSVAEDLSSVTELFAKFFRSVYTEDSSSSTAPDLGTESNITNHGISFSVDQVGAALVAIKSKTCTGPDDIPSILLKECSSALVWHLTHLFNYSLMHGVFPKLWKSSYIIPIHKSGLKNWVENYRGIAILSVIPKLFEKLVRDSLIFDVKNLIVSQQHGFCAGRSTATNLAIFVKDTVCCLEKGIQMDVIYTDFSKAFDKINHNLLIDKLTKLNTNKVPVKWISSYLSRRSQFVRIGDTFSRQIQVSSGVPQGSHLGPLLFILFVNNVVDCFRFCKCLLYADDIKIFAGVRDIEDVLLVQQDLDCFLNWTVENRLALNVSKCKSMTYSKMRIPIASLYRLDDVVLEVVCEISDLGVLFISNLDFSKHIDKIVAKANSMLGFIKRLVSDFSDPYTLKTLYISFVRPVLEYASVIWSSSYGCHSDRIESIQKKFLKFALRRLPRLTNSFILPPYDGRCMLLNIASLKSRRDTMQAMFTRDVLCSKIDSPDLLYSYSFYVPTRVLRPRQNILKVDFHRTNYGRDDPVARTSRIFNLFSDNFDFNISRDLFKKRIASVII